MVVPVWLLLQDNLEYRNVVLGRSTNHRRRYKSTFDIPIHLSTNNAGLHGLIMAKTYLEIHPAATLLVVDEAHSVGGTWAAERLYPGLKTNNVFGSYELSDFPMVAEKYEVDGTGHIPGHVVHEYLCDVADHFGITPCLRLGTRVTSAELNDKGVWEVRVESTNEPGIIDSILATRLVVATGLTSKPHIPNIPGSETFGGLIVHSKQLKEHAQPLAKSRRVVVVGGNKSAWDVCYTAVQSGSQVDMVIRPSGGGPSYLWPRSFSLGPFKTSLAKLSTTRFFTLFDPAPFYRSGKFSWMKWVLHRTALGQRICRYFWTYLDSIIRGINGYSTHPELKKLGPWTTPFWMGNSLSVHNYETSWFDLVRDGRIRVHITDLASLSPGEVHLGNGEILDADALVLCTGWATDIPVKLGVLETGDLNDGKEAVKTVYDSVPYLESLPRRTSSAPICGTVSPGKLTDFPLLYRDMIPAQTSIKQRNLAFIGMSVSIHAALVAQAQSLWIAAFFEDKIEHLNSENCSLENVKNRAFLERTYGEIRRPRETGGLAGQHADLVFDSLPYVDELLGDLGLMANRKGNWWRELTEAYSPGDFKGLVHEWLGLRLQCYLS
ncbi:hypothetical protein ASPVEDRAFT_47395 [Aspergillus versicolor CBS 583.65]|uniref:L-ornithine N(5)-oxygenase n=1 Tax=Aspergillus versicolor CBS 583.65 TaxID=1036611 RepID=A0A1L9Q3A6_ASPVE|nr:uncharacterized protein ASPVEDRAFT_47395 [Aspergillus versicolor CBS 583.65]OJJ08216.1 hypothetical protein ASPVEDRAFT_47395 [Aspergillus versicolor CBS 583.65]